MHKKKRINNVWIKRLKFLTYSSHTISTDTNQSRLLNVCVWIEHMYCMDALSVCLENSLPV